MANEAMQREYVERMGEDPGAAALTRRLASALRNRHRPLSRGGGHEWGYLEELTVGDRRLDALSIRLRYPFERHAYEIKASRGDFLAEIRRPEKRLRALEIANRYSLVTPAGLIDPDELPEECGLIEVILGKRSSMYDRTRQKVRAPFRDVADPPLSLFAEVMRRAS